MHTRHLISLAALVGLSVVSRADYSLLSDNFSGPSLDATKCTTILPTGGSSVTQSGGMVTTSGRGILATVNSYSQPYTISGAFTMLGDWEHFNVAFRTDLSTPGAPFYERAGMLVSFSNDGDEISIQRYASPVDWDILAGKSFSLVTGQSYFFSIFDDGTNIDFEVNGVHQLSAASTYSTGGQIALYSREFGEGSQIDAVAITSVPEVGVTALYAGLAILGLVAARRRVAA